MTPEHPDSVLRHRPFVQFWLARVSTTMAYQMLVVAIGWQLYELTGNPLDLGLVGLVQFIPGILLVLVIGQVTDRYDRRAILSTCQVVEAVTASALLMAALSGAISRELILGAAFVMGAARAFELTAMQTIVPSLVPLPLVPRAVAGSATANQSATIIGPALGGFVYAVSPLIVYGACCALFVLAGALVTLIRIERSTAAARAVHAEGLLRGLRLHPPQPDHPRRDLARPVRRAARRRDRAVAGVRARYPCGGPLGARPVARRARGRRARHGDRADALVVRPQRRAASCSRRSRPSASRPSCSRCRARSWSRCVALVVLGASDMVSVVIRMTLVQLGTPDEMRGRVTAVNALFIGASNQLGEFRAGAAAAWLGAVPTVLIGGIGTLVIVALVDVAVPAARADRPAGGCEAVTIRRHQAAGAARRT